MRVSPLCLGALNFGAATNEADSIRIVHAALEAGINFIDTANSYNAGQSEVMMGKALEGRRDNVFLATKVHGKVGDGPNDQGNSRLHTLISLPVTFALFLPDGRQSTAVNGRRLAL